MLLTAPPSPKRFSSSVKTLFARTSPRAPDTSPCARNEPPRVELCGRQARWRLVGRASRRPTEAVFVSLYSSSLELYAPGDEPSRRDRTPLQVLQLTAIVTISENLEEPHALRLAVAGPRGPATHELQFFSDADADHLRVSIRAARRTLLRSMQVPRSKSDELLDAELHRSFSAFGMDTAAIGAGSTPSRPAAIVEGRAAHAATPTAAEEQPAGSEGRGPATAPPEADGEEALPAEAARPAEQARPPTEATGEGAGAAAGGDASPAAEADHEEDLDLLLGEGGGVRAASPARLIELLVHPSRFDHRFCSALLLTYRSFFTPAELLRELTGRCSLPTALEGREGAGEGAALQPVRLMVCNVLQKWVRHYLRDDEMTPELLEALHSFVDGPLAESEQTRALSALLKRAVAKRTVRRRSGPRAGRSQAPAPALTRSFDSDPPLPLFDLDGFGALDRVASVHPREWARQLTRREFDLLERIGPSELLRQAWAGAEKKARAPNVLALVGLANATAAWVASVVLSEAELCARAEAYGHLVDVAAECLALRNFNGVFTILAGLELASVHRLKATKGALAPRHRAALEDLTDLVSYSANRRRYRRELEAATPPCVPYLGVFLTDLTFLEQGNPATVEVAAPCGGPPRQLVNWSKHQAYARVLEDVRFYQQSAYNLAPCLPLELYLECAVPQLLLDEDEQYERSLQLEPRGEDELPAAGVAAAAEEAARRDSARKAGMRRLEEAADQLAASCREHAIARREREASAAGLEV